MGDIVGQLRLVVKYGYDSETRELKRDIGHTPFMQLKDDKHKIAFKKLCKLIVDTDYFKKPVRYYIMNIDASADYVAVAMKQLYGLDIKVNTLYQYIFRDKKRFIEDFGEDFVNDIGVYSGDVARHIKKLDKYINYFSDPRSLCSLDLTSSKFETELSDEEWDKFLSTIRPYGIRSMDKVNNKLPEKAVAYMNHLAEHKSLSVNDIARLNKYMRIMGGKL